MFPGFNLAADLQWIAKQVIDSSSYIDVVDFLNVLELQLNDV